MEHQQLPSPRPIKYLVCVDAREESRVALRLACARAKSRGRRQINLLHVIPPPDMQMLGLVAEKINEERRAEAEVLLQKHAEEAYALSGIMPTLMLRQGAIGDEIVAAAGEDPEISMLVLGVAQEGTRGTLLAWLASQLGAKLFVPIMLVPGNLTDHQIEMLV